VVEEESPAERRSHTDLVWLCCDFVGRNYNRIYNSLLLKKKAGEILVRERLISPLLQ